MNDLQSVYDSVYWQLSGPLIAAPIVDSREMVQRARRTTRPMAMTLWRMAAADCEHLSHDKPPSECPPDLGADNTITPSPLMNSSPTEMGEDEGQMKVQERGVEQGSWALRAVVTTQGGPDS